jgi:uncharacterized protein (TIGR00162 family)
MGNTEEKPGRKEFKMKNMNKTKEEWTIKETKFTARDPILIEGLPGIGNVGKIALDYIIEKTKNKKIADIFSYSVPNTVFINKENMVEMPKIEIYHINHNNQDFLFLIGDVQPSNERASFEFCETILDWFQGIKGKRIITLGGIGLGNVPENPKVFITGNDSNFINDFKKEAKVNPEIYGVVGPIIGVSGLLVGLSEKRNIPSVILLAETFKHPLFLGLKGAREIINVLTDKYGFKVDLKELNKEIKEVEKEIDNVENLLELFQKKQGKFSKYKSHGSDMNYIG